MSGSMGDVPDGVGVVRDDGEGSKRERREWEYRAGERKERA